MKKFAFIAIIVVALVTALGFSACTATVTAGGNNNTTTTGVSGTIVNGHWTSNTYVSGDVTVTGSLIIDPGVTVTLDSGYSISISTGAAFSAIGTAANPITFKSSGASIVWKQIYIDDGAGTAPVPIKMTYCTVSGAGYGGSPYAIEIGFNYYTAVVDIENCTITGNSAGGINAIHAGPKSVIKGNTFYANTDFGLYVNDNVAFDNTNGFAASGPTGTVDLTNLKNSVAFAGDISSSRTFDIVQVPYYFDSSVNVLNGGTLIIQKGATILFNTACYLSVNAGGNFSAVGTALAPITFKPKANTTNWQDIYLDDGAGTALVPLTMKYCTVTGAGTNGNSYYAIQLGFNYQTVVADIENCTITGNLNGGIWAEGAGSGTVISNNTFSGNNTNAVTGPYDIDVHGATGLTVSGNLPSPIIYFSLK